MPLDPRGWKERWPQRMAEYRFRIPPSHRSRFRRFLEWLGRTGMENPGPSDLRPEQLARYAETLSGEKTGTQGAYLMGAVRGAQIVAPGLDLGVLRRRAQDLMNAGRARPKTGRSKSQGRQATLSLPVAQWPHGHRRPWQGALAAMQSACGEDDEDPFGRYAHPETMPAFSRNPGTRRNHAHAWGRWLWVMQQARQGWEVTPHRLETFIRSCLSTGCSHGGVATYLSSILFMIPIVAPRTDSEIVDILRMTRDSEVERHGAAAVREIVHPSQLARIGLGLMQRAEQKPMSSESAIEYRDGLLIWAGTVIPARSINLGGLRLGRDLFLDEDPRIVWQAIDIKGKVSYSYDLPAEVADRMRVMWDKYRPMLMGADADTQDYFWGPRRGGSGLNRGLTTSAINRIVTKRSSELLKKRVTGCSRRHSVATMITEEAPENVEHVTTLLQQGSSRSRSFYNRRAKKVRATKIAAECIAERRKVRYP